MNRFLFIVMLATSSASVRGQSVSVGVFGGISNYQGDLTTRLYDKNLSKGVGGVSVSYALSEHWSLRGSFAFTKLTASDKYNGRESLRVRNLNFTTSVSEASVVAEYATFNLDDKRFTPYLFGGLGLFHFNPYTYTDSGAKVFLKPLSTEGEGLSGYPKPYRTTQVNMPFGGGLRYALTENLRVGLELGIRKLFTDYLDDVSTNYAAEADLLAARGPLAVSYAYRGDEVAGGSGTYPQKGAQRGGSLSKDAYYFTTFTLSFRLGNKLFNHTANGRGRSGYGCPASPL